MLFSVEEIYRLETALPSDVCANSQRRADDISTAFCSFGEDKMNGNNPSAVLGEALPCVSYFEFV